jgi:hypothetical protein
MSEYEGKLYTQEELRQAAKDAKREVLDRIEPMADQWGSYLTAQKGE